MVTLKLETFFHFTLDFDSTATAFDLDVPNYAWLR